MEEFQKAIEILSEIEYFNFNDSELGNNIEVDNFVMLKFPNPKGRPAFNITFEVNILNYYIK